MSWTERLSRLAPEPSSAKELRSFGLIVGGIFGIIGVWPLLRHGVPIRMWAVVVAAPLILTAFIRPWGLRYPFRVWMLLGHCLGWVNSRVIMTLVFYLVVTPTAFVLRAMKRDAMTRALDPSANTYRVVKTPRQPSHLSHPF